MAVNENVYGKKENWLTYKRNYIKIPPYSTITSGVNNSYITKDEEINKSICTVQCDNNFSGGILNYIRGGAVDNFDEKNVLYDIFQEFEIKNLALFSFSTATTTGNSIINLSNFSQYLLAPNYVATNNKNTVKPILSYGNNQNIKLVIHIAHSSTYNYNYNDRLLTDLDTFIASGNKYVFGVYAIPYILVNGSWTVYDYDDFSLTYQIINYPTKNFKWIGANTINSRYYSLIEKTRTTVTLKNGNRQIKQVFPIFSQYDNNDPDHRTLYNSQSNQYFPIIGYMPTIINSELQMNNFITENGVTIRKTYAGGYSQIDANRTLSRYIDLTDTDYWGGDYTKFVEWCKKQTAYFGMFFTTAVSYLNNGFDNENTYLGLIDIDGVTHGEYSQGSENSEQRNYNNDIISDIEKTPPEKIQNDKGDLTSNINPFIYKSPNKLFILNETDLNDLFTFINIGYRPSEENFILDFKGKNPIDYIVSVNVFPFDIPTIAPTEVDLSIGGIPVKKAPFLETAETVKVKQLGLASEFVQPIFDFGTVSINPYFNDFRDYEPFTKCEVQLPYCGSYTVDLKKFMNKNLSVKYVVDYNTGACTALIFLNDLLIDTVDGQIGFSIPLSGIAQGEYQNTIQRNSYNAKMAGYEIVGSAINNATSMISGISNKPKNTNGIFARKLSGIGNNVINSLETIETGLQANYELTHTAPQPTILSTADTLNSFCQDNRARVLFYRCEIPRYDEEVFKKTVGYACIKSGKVSDFTGLMICSNVKLDNINCTDTEKNILKNLLTSGVYN